MPHRERRETLERERTEMVDAGGSPMLSPDVEQNLYLDVLSMIDLDASIAKAIQFQLAKVPSNRDSEQWAGMRVHDVLMARAKTDGVRSGSFTYELLKLMLHADARAWRWIGGYYLEVGA